ncbi:MAG TPA: hypothetical protein VGW38_11680 [Chloroflexota bacterium]|nr:hypothetical protein [Chloroflexota bacterium]
MNAAALDPQFRADLLASPLRTATRAERTEDHDFGCRLPDPLMRLPSIQLTERDKHLLREISSASSLADLWQQLTAVAMSVGS